MHAADTCTADTYTADTYTADTYTADTYAADTCTADACTTDDTDAADAEDRAAAGVSLVREAARMAPRDEDGTQRPPGRPVLPAEAWEGGDEGPVVLFDGYVRQSPVQAYRVPVGWRKGLMLRILGFALLAALAALLIAALVRSHFMGLVAW